MQASDVAATPASGAVEIADKLASIDDLQLEIPAESAQRGGQRLRRNVNHLRSTCLCKLPEAWANDSQQARRGDYPNTHRAPQQTAIRPPSAVAGIWRP